MSSNIQKVRSTRGGFTLIEILIVVIILATTTVAVVAVVRKVRAGRRARDEALEEILHGS